MILAGVIVLAAACGDDDADPEPSDGPPWALTGIEMPDTEEAVIAVLEALPEIDGRQPTLLRDEESLGVDYGESESGGVGIGAWPDDEPTKLLAQVIEHMTAEGPAEGLTVEASALDPNGDLVWVASTDTETFGLLWADPDGSWVFNLAGDSAEFRVRLIQAFITAGGG
jgi:hypothetical protein